MTNWRFLIVLFAWSIAGPPLLVRYGPTLAGGDRAPAAFAALYEEGVQVLHFWRPTCPVSIRTQGAVRALQRQGVPIESINTLVDPEKSLAHQVQATPTFIVVDDQRERSRHAGGLTAREIRALLEDP